MKALCASGICSALLILAFSIGTGARADDAVQMTTFEENGLVLSGAEYWPYKGSVDFNYPNDVLWGFYPQAGVVPPDEEDPNPDSATPAAIACATMAWTKLKAFIHSNPADLQEVIRLGAANHFITPKFYLWTNDYSRATNPYPFTYRPSKFWFWKRNPQVEGRTPGYWKWESTVGYDGTCSVPSDTQIHEYLAQKLAEIRQRP